MVFPLLIPLALGGGVFAGVYGLQKLFDQRRCDEIFDGSCDRECDYYTGDEETCYYCLGTCGVEEIDYPYYISKLEYYERDSDRWSDDEEREYRPKIYRDRDGDDDRKERDRRRPKNRPREHYAPPGHRDRDEDREDEDEDRDDSDKYGIGRGRGKKKNGKTLLQDRLDNLSKKGSREHTGGGHADMTQDTRGMYGFIVS